MQDLTVGSASVLNMSTGADTPAWINPNNVDFKVAYADDFKGAKPLPEGDIINVSKEVAEDFTGKGFGKVYTDEDRKADAAKATDSKEAEATNTVVEEVPVKEAGKAAKATDSKEAKK